MQSEPNEPESPPHSTVRFKPIQISLRMLLIVTTTFGVLCAFFGSSVVDAVQGYGWYWAPRELLGDWLANPAFPLLFFSPMVLFLMLGRLVCFSPRPISGAVFLACFAIALGHAFATGLKSYPLFEHSPWYTGILFTLTAAMFLEVMILGLRNHLTTLCCALWLAFTYWFTSMGAMVIN